MKKYLLLATILCSSTTFAASNDTYVGGGLHIGNYDEDGISAFNPLGLKLEISRYLTDQIALEAHIAVGVKDDSNSIVDEDTGEKFNAKVKVKQAISLFVKADLPVTNNINVYGLLGGTSGKLEFAVPEFDEQWTGKDSGFSYGVGVESAIGNGLSVSGEYIVYLSEDDYDYSGLNLSLAKKF